MQRRAGSQCNNWETLDGNPVTYLDFDRGEPSNGGASCSSRVLENCAGFKYQNGNARWYDSQCTPNGASTTFVAQCVVCAVQSSTVTTTAANTSNSTTITTTNTSSSTLSVPLSPPLTVPHTTTSSPVPQQAPAPTPTNGTSGSSSPAASAGVPGTIASNLLDTNQQSDTDIDNASSTDIVLIATIAGVVAAFIVAITMIVVIVIIRVRRRDNKNGQQHAAESDMTGFVSARESTVISSRSDIVDPGFCSPTRYASTAAAMSNRISTTHYDALNATNNEVSLTTGNYTSTAGTIHSVTSPYDAFKAMEI